MAAGCAARSCTDVYDSVKVRRLKEWDESDAKFLRKLSIMTREINMNNQENRKLFSAASSSNVISIEISDSLDDRFACRQRFLRSYTFCKEKDKQTTGFLQMIKQWVKMMKMKKKKCKGQNGRATSNKDSGSSLSLWKGWVEFLLS
ncbi:hypothetical protein OWV82_013423 [Melia azedarach]|uniref:Uncharacterized protein n=1 Tax=Melia azedarach TaxID=155640 RepID=A0ACC1XUJ7_MELAZ|nr:hypothetical protein OWV82_013423 [Melia azedarach]